MRQNFTQRFIDLRRFGLAPQAFTELRLNHRKGTFDVGALVVMGQKFVALVVVEVENARPQLAVAVRLAIRLEGDVRDSAMLQSRLEVAVSQVGFVGRDFLHRKAILRSLIYEWFEIVVIIRVSFTDFNTRHDVGFDAAHEMHLDPLMLFHLSAILGIKPAQEVSGSETRTIHRKVGFDALERQAGLSNELFKVWRQRLTFEITRDAVVVRQFGDKAARVRFSQVSSKAATGERCVGFEDHAKQHISNGQAWTPEPVDRCFDSRAEFIEQGLKLAFLMRLRGVVSTPLLPICLALDLDRFGNGSLAVFDYGGLRALYLFKGELNGVKMFASGASKLIIAASTMRLFGVRVNGVLLVAVLGRNEPQAILFGEFGLVGNLKPSLFSSIHRVISFLGKHTAEAYNSFCVGHTASAVWLKAVTEVSASVTVAKLVESVRFELTDGVVAPSLVSKASGLNRSPSPPLTSSFLTSLFCIFYRLSQRAKPAAPPCGFSNNTTHCRTRCISIRNGWSHAQPSPNRRVYRLGVVVLRNGSAATCRAAVYPRSLNLPLVDSLTVSVLCLNFSVLFKPFQNGMDRRKDAFLGNIETRFFETCPYSNGRQKILAGKLQHGAYSIRESNVGLQFGEQFGVRYIGVDVTERRKSYYAFSNLADAIINFLSLIIQFIAPLHQAREFLNSIIKYVCVSILIYHVWEYN